MIQKYMSQVSVHLSVCPKLKDALQEILILDGIPSRMSVAGLNRIKVVAGSVQYTVSSQSWYNPHYFRHIEFLSYHGTISKTRHLDAVYRNNSSIFIKVQMCIVFSTLKE